MLFFENKFKKLAYNSKRNLYNQKTKILQETNEINQKEA